MDIYFTRYHRFKSITILNLYYDKLIGNIKKYEGKKYLMVDDCTLDKVLDKIKRIGIEKFGCIKIFIDSNDKLPDDVTLRKCWDINDTRY